MAIAKRSQYTLLTIWPEFPKIPKKYNDDEVNTLSEREEKIYNPKLECMPRMGERYYNRGLQQEIEYAYENAPAMRAKFDKAGVRPSHIRTVKDLEKQRDLDWILSNLCLKVLFLKEPRES
jgi:hypothetical protein